MKEEAAAAQTRWVRPTARVMFAAGPLTAIAMWLLGRIDVVASVPLWLMLPVFVVSQSLFAYTSMRFHADPSPRRLQILIASQVTATTLVMYMTGWGPVLIVGYGIVAADVMSAAGSRSWKSLLGWSLAGVAMGQAAIVAGIAPSFIHQPEVDGLAALAALGTAFMITALGVSARRAESAEGAVRESEEGFRLLFERNPQPMWLFDLETLGFVEVNGAAVDHYGYSREEFATMRIVDLRPESDRPRLGESIAIPGDGVRHAGIWHHLTKAGEPIEVEITSHRLEFRGRPCSLVLANDVTDQLQAQRELTRQALHDNLTGLPNRSLITDRLTHALARADVGETSVTVIFLDLDRFKVINDGRGHRAGDQLLIKVARRIELALTPADTVGRIGGDEFVIIIETDDPGEGSAAAKRIAKYLEAPFTLDGLEVFVSASQGVAPARPGDTAEGLLARADAAMYVAKDQGRARAVVADEDVVAQAAGRLDLELALRHAIERDELVVYYQPVVDVASGTIVGAEALVRWQHPERGLLGPIEFIPVAEQSGLIVPIGEWVLQKALDEAKSWPDHLSIAVNISPVQLLAPRLPSLVTRALRSSGVDPTRLHLEITEGVLIENLDHSVAILSALRESGVQVDVDDFGTGYSSLSYIQRLPVDALKIDRSFVSRLESDGADPIVSTVVGLASSLRLGVIAEGVETEGQRTRLLELGCTQAQGYHFAKPMPGEDFACLVSNFNFSLIA